MTTPEIKKLKAKKNKRGSHARTNTINCPNCLSKLVPNDIGVLICSGDRLKVWEEAFKSYHDLSAEEKVVYLSNVASSGTFEELYDRWVYAHINNTPEEFNCGYTNTVFSPHGSIKVRIPDPLVVKRLEEKLGRELTEEEVYGEKPLYTLKGKVFSRYRKKSREVKIPFIMLPEEVEVTI